MKKWFVMSMGGFFLWWLLKKKDSDPEIMKRVLQFREDIRLAASRHGVPPEILAAQVHFTSEGNPNMTTGNGETAYGLMQILCGDARKYGFTEECSVLLKPIVNLHFGAMFFRWHIDANDGDIYRAIVDSNYQVALRTGEERIWAIEYYAKRTLALASLYEGKF